MQHFFSDHYVPFFFHRQEVEAGDETKPKILCIGLVQNFKSDIKMSDMMTDIKEGYGYVHKINHKFILTDLMTINGSNF